MHVKVVVTVGGERGTTTLSADGDIDEPKAQSAFLYDIHQMTEKLVRSPKEEEK